MMKNIETIPKLDKKRGEQITYTEINELAIEVYNKFNFLHSENVMDVDTSKWLDYTAANGEVSKAVYIYYPNYCGWMIYTDPTPSASVTKRTYEKATTIDVPLAEANSELDELINKHNGV